MAHILALKGSAVMTEKMHGNKALQMVREGHKLEDDKNEKCASEYLAILS